MSTESRKARVTNSENIWQLMKELAISGNTLTNFLTIAPKILQKSGFGKSPPDFHCIATKNNTQLVGLFVYFSLLYTSLNRPAVYMKGLHVTEPYRSQKGERFEMAAIP